MEKVEDWLNNYGLSPTVEKNEAVLITETRKRAYDTLTVNEKKCKMGDTIEYLRVTMDAWLSFKDHLRNAGLKTSILPRALAGIIPNIARPPRRFLLSSVVYFVILQGAPDWADTISSNPS